MLHTRMATFRLSKQGWCVILILAAVFILYYLSGSSYIGRLQGNVISIRSLLIKCVHLSEDAGYFITSKDSSSVSARVKAPSGGLINELLTTMDLTSHSVIVSGLTESFPGIQIISEEHPPPSPSNFQRATALSHSTVDENLSDGDFFVPASDVTIWVDPLDATQELTEGLLEYVTVMVCITLRGYPIAGVIHQPFTRRTYWAWREHGISSDLANAIKNATTSSILTKGVLVVTHSRSHLNTSLTGSVVDAFKPQEVSLLPAGGSGFKVLSLIQGKAHLYLHPSSSRRWDVCAAQAVLEAAGGRMTGLDGSQLSYDPRLPRMIPKTTGLYAASSKELYDRWATAASKVSFHQT